MRAVYVYGARLLVLSGRRPKVLIRHPADTMKTYRHIPTVLVGDVFDALPYDCVPVGVDLVDGAKPLPDYEHPQRAFYIFGAEDATLGARVLDRCRDRVLVPTVRCMTRRHGERRALRPDGKGFPMTHPRPVEATAACGRQGGEDETRS
jgi:hypothetical protein